MNRVAPLSRTPLVELSRFDHPSDTVHRDPGEERAGFVTVSFVERGGFGLRVGRAHSRVDQRWVFVTWPDLVFHCDHERHAPPDDVCTSLAFEPGFASEVLWACGASHGLPAPVVPLTNRLAYLRYSLLAAASGDALGTETIAAEILGEAARPTAAPTHLFRHGQLSWYAARVDAARERLRAGYAEPHSLRDLAREAGMSPYHFARVFRELLGMPPHRYLRGLRLRMAAERLREGESVTAACFDSGFSNLSHFTRSFRRTFGVAPSRFAR